MVVEIRNEAATPQRGCMTRFSIDPVPGVCIKYSSDRPWSTASFRTFFRCQLYVLAVCGRLGLDGVTFEIGALRQPHLGASTVETAEA